MSLALGYSHHSNVGLIGRMVDYGRLSLVSGLDYCPGMQAVA